MRYKGVVIEESLADKDVLSEMTIISTKIEKVIAKHKTPWLKRWSLHTVEISENKVDEIASKVSQSLDSEHSWYVDFKNDKYHYIIYQGKIFKVDLKNPTLYKKAKNYGISLGIPSYQVDFAPDDKLWER